MESLSGIPDSPTYFSSPHISLTSNPIEVEIVVAEPDWQRRQLEQIVSALPATLFSRTEAQRAAVRALVGLGTDAALQVIRDRLGTHGTTEMDLDWRIARLVLLQQTANKPAL
jgi:hypothetical protein